MASKQRWSSVLGARDVYELMDAFESMNLIIVEIKLTLRNSAGSRGPWLTAEAFTRHPAPVGRVLLASESLQCSTTDFQSLDIAAFRLLYALDRKLDELDPANAGTTNAVPGNK